MKQTLHSPAGLFVAAIAMGATVLLTAITWWQVDQTERRELRAMQQQSELQARAFGEHADSIVRLVDLALDELVRNWEGFQAFHRQSTQISERLGNLAVQVGATNDQGLLASTMGAPPKEPVLLADREHIRVHLDGKVDGLFISNPVLGRVSKKWSIQFSRAVRKAGRVEAVIVISIDPTYFSDFYGELAEAKQGDVIVMVKPNGAILARAPDAAKFLGVVLKGLPFQSPGAPASGTFQGTSQTDGLTRIAGWYRAPYSGLTLVSGIGREDGLKAFRQQRNALLTASTLMVVLIWVAAAGALNYLRRRVQAADAMRLERHRLEQAVAERTTVLSSTLDQLQSSQADLQMARSALASASNGIVIADARQTDLPMVYVNDAFERITGFARADVLGRNCRFLHRGDFEQPELEALRAAIREGRACRVRLRNYRNGGELFYNDLSISPLRDDAGQLTHFVGIQSDVTERVVLEEQVRETQKMDAIGQLTGGLAHDFNNLLGVVIGNLDLLADKLPGDEATQRQHRAALDAALRGAEVTRSLLAVARRQPLHTQMQDLNGLVAEMLPLVRSSAGSAVVVRSQLWRENLPARLDASGLSNAVLNLVINARDAMREWEGEKRLTISTERLHLHPGEDPQLHSGDYAVLQVADTGPGMSEDVRRKAFDPFFTTKPHGRGTGLGLSMVLGFAEQLGGTARIDSAPGRGTRVRLVLPLARDEVPTPAGEDGAVNVS